MRNLIDKKKLTPFLEEKYGFKAAQIDKGPRGFVAETFIIKTDSGKYFIKASKRGGYSKYIVKSLPVLDELYNLGLKQTAKPLKTKSNELFCEFGDHVVVIFDFIEGEWSFDCDFEKTVQILAELHGLTGRISSKVEKEDFKLPLENEYLEHFEKLQKIKYDNKYIKKLASVITSRRNRLENLWQFFKQRANECQNSNFDLVLTHGDALCNLIKGPKEEVFLVDWDDILLAPAERDNWFLLVKDKQDKFLQTYRRYFPEYQPNQTAYEFYVLRRYFDDIEGFIKEMLEQKSDEAKKQNLKELYEIFVWLDPVIKKFV